jgi:hypothetical protein
MLVTLVCHEQELVGQLYMSAREVPKKLSTIAAWMLLLTLASLSRDPGPPTMISQIRSRTLT